MRRASCFARRANVRRGSSADCQIREVSRVPSLAGAERNGPQFGPRSVAMGLTP